MRKTRYTNSDRYCTWIRNLSVATLGCAGTLLVLSSFVSAKTEPAAERLLSRAWDAESNLPHGKVCALERTRDGYLWLGTPAGLVRFDGVRFEVFNHLNTAVLQNSRILCLHEDKSGALWIGTDGGGLYSYKNGEWGSFGMADGLMSNHVRAICEDMDGHLWIGTEYGLHQLHGNGVMRVIGLDEGLADNLITCLAADGLGRVWAGTMRGGLARIEEGLVQIYDYKVGLEDPAVLSMAVGPENRVWIGTMSRLYYLEPEAGIVRPIAEAMGYPVTSLAVSPGGGLFVGTIEGLKVWDGSTLTDIFTDEELRGSYVCDILPDEEGFIWVGTEANGLVQLKERRVDAISAADGLPAGGIFPLLAGGDGTLWAGTEKDGLYRVSSGRVEAVSNRERGLAGDMVRALMMDRSGALWVGTMDGGLSVISGGRMRNLATVDGLSSDNITVLLQDSEGVVWIGTDRGLDYHRMGEIEERGSVQMLVDQTIRTLYESPNGTLCAGTKNGVWKRSGPCFERVVTGSDSTSFDALSLYEDTTGTLWAGTNGSGLKRLRDKGLITFTTADGLPGNFIFSILEDDDGSLWMSCENGVFAVSRDSLNAYAAGAVNILSPTLYNEADGMPSSRCSGFCRPAVCASRSGKLLYPTDAGIAVIDPRKEREPSRPPVVRIEEILADDVPIGLDGDIEVPAGTERMEIQFTAFDYAAPEKLRFLYMLEGLDSRYTAVHPSRPRRALYHDLPPGEYTFSVRAVGNGGVWSKGAATVRFTVLPPFYRTKIFLFIIIASVVLAAGSVLITSRYRKIKKQRLKYSTTSISDERMEGALAELTEMMEVEKVYLDPDLTLQKLAKQLRIHYNHLSRIINERFGVSFKNYINRYRVDEAKRRLSDPAEKDRNITDIMLDAGFYSKSTFNTAFRKFTGTSPSTFRKKNNPPNGV